MRLAQVRKMWKPKWEAYVQQWTDEEEEDEDILLQMVGSTLLNLGFSTLNFFSVPVMVPGPQIKKKSYKISVKLVD